MLLAIALYYFLIIITHCAQLHLEYDVQYLHYYSHYYILESHKFLNYAKRQSQLEYVILRQTRPSSTTSQTSKISLKAYQTILHRTLRLSLIICRLNIKTTLNMTVALASPAILDQAKTLVPYRKSTEKFRWRSFSQQATITKQSNKWKWCIIFRKGPHIWDGHKRTCITITINTHTMMGAYNIPTWWMLSELRYSCSKLCI